MLPEQSLVTDQAFYVVVFFVMAYLYILIKKTVLRKVEVIDFLLLSSVAIFPAIFVLFQDFTLLVANSIGIRSPFILMFAGLFLVLFWLVHRLCERLMSAELRCRTLVQELALSNKRNEDLIIKLEQC